MAKLTSYDENKGQNESWFVEYACVRAFEPHEALARRLHHAARSCSFGVPGRLTFAPRATVFSISCDTAKQRIPSVLSTKSCSGGTPILVSTRLCGGFFLGIHFISRSW